MTATDTGFRPPPYPYDRLRELGAVAAASPGGLVDLSVGTPGDPPLPAVVAALGESGTERGYPSSVGSPAFRQAAAHYVSRRFEVELAPEALAACVGTKEFVASAAWYLRLRNPERDTVIGPALAYPTYSMGATLAGCRYIGIEAGPDGDYDLGSVSDQDAGRALVLWVNSPGNPNGAVVDLAPLVDWGRRHHVPVLSDECYSEFIWNGPGTTVLQLGNQGVLALHSLSKRSNLAGVRSGFYSGDPELVGYLSSVRTHAGLMVPGPVQAASVVALDDEEHVERQRRRYRSRLERTVAAFDEVGLEARLPDGGFYLWVPVPPWASGRRAEGIDGAWVLAESLARVAGILVSPGEFYGEAGRGFVRVALVAPDEMLVPALERLVAGGAELAR